MGDRASAETNDSMGTGRPGRRLRQQSIREMDITGFRVVAVGDVGLCCPRVIKIFFFQKMEWLTSTAVMSFCNLPNRLLYLS